MDVEKKKVAKTILAIILIVILLLLCWLFLGGNSFAKYKKEVYSDSFTEVAKPVFIVDGADNIKINGIEDTVYQFSVKNYDDSGINEVDMNYYVQIINHSNANLEFVLTKSGELIDLVENKTNLISVSNLGKQEDNYQLKIKYHDVVNKEIEGNVQIKIEAIQARK